MPYVSFHQVSVGDVIRFGPRKRWGLVREIAPGAPTHWELIWLYGKEWGRSETVTPDERGVYFAMDEADARRERVRLLL